MKRSITLMWPLIIVITLNCFENAAAQDYCNTPRFDTTDVFKPAQLADTTLVYGYNVDWQGNHDTLHVRLIYPNNRKDNYSIRPLIVMVHGGGFVDGDIKSTKKKQIYFATKGFVTASIEYRLGWLQNCVPGNDTSLAYAMYRAVQDVNAAIRYLVNKAPTFKIDTSKILLHGESAGAVACLTNAFVDMNEFNAKFPGTSAKLGGLNNATNNLTNAFSVKGVFAQSGALFDTSFIGTAEIIPLLLVHGSKDKVVPFVSGYAYGCNYYPYFYGSSSIQKRVQNLGDCYELDYQPSGGHGTVYQNEDTFVNTRESHFYKKLLCKDCHQIIYKDETLVQDKTLSSNIISQSLQHQNIFSQEFSANVFPNPSSNEFTLTFQKKNSKPVEVQVMDVFGKIIYVSKEYSEHMFTFGKNFTAGMYFVRIMQGNNTTTIKILKQ